MATRWEDVEHAFRNHVRHYAEHGRGESALVGRRAEGSVTLQYAGRVVLELVQNALDRADGLVLVRLDGNELLVANDGRGFTVDRAFDYNNPAQGVSRADFNALCALHTSNKSPEEHFGNKGIGFRSVFGVARSVQVWSRLVDGSWWGLELRANFVPTTWPDSPIPDLDSLVRSSGDELRPSFHFPIPMRSDAAPRDGLDDAGAETAVLVPVDDDRHLEQIQHEVQALARTRLHFIALRRDSLRIDVSCHGAQGATHSTPSTETGWDVCSDAYPEHAALAHAAGHEIKEPQIAVAWPPPGEGTRDIRGWFYNYLPTRIPAGLPVDVHGDFQVKADREGMALAPDNDVGRFNATMLREAAAQHVQRLLAECKDGIPREDLWQLANRPSDGPASWTQALRDALIPGDDWRQWAAMARAYFAVPRERIRFAEFWEASARWVDRVAGYSRRSQTWSNKAQALCAVLAEQEIPLIPVRSSTGETAVPLPVRADRGQRAERRVFRIAESDRPVPPIPGALLELQRAATDFSLGDWESPAGVSRFEAQEVLRDLRQVPRNPTDYAPEGHLAEGEQVAMLRFARALLGDERPPHFAWRAFDSRERDRRMGQAIATLYLPLRTGGWAPARQLSADLVDTERYTESGEPLLNETLLTWLGVAPAGAVPLLEDGVEGVVPVLQAPPELQAAGTDNVRRPLAPRLDVDITLEAARGSLRDLPEDHEESRVYAVMAHHRWLSSDVLRADPRLPPLPERVAPAVVVRERRDPRTIFLAVPNSDDDDWLFDKLRSPRKVEEIQRLDGSAASILTFLAERFTEPRSLAPSLRQRLCALHEALVAALPTDVNGPLEVPLLVEENGQIEWWDGERQVWLPRDQDRYELRRFFPDVPLVVGAGGAPRAQALGVGELVLRRTIQPRDLPEPDAIASEVHQRVEKLLGALSAVAELTRQVTPDADRIRRAWNRWPLRRVTDAWLDLDVEGPERDTVSWHQGHFDDVFYVPGEGSEEPGVIVFDTPPDRQTAPPLAVFGEALAQLLFNNAAIGPVLGQALAAAAEGHLDTLLERRHGVELRREWDRRLAPLPEAQRQRLVEILEPWCTDAAAVLQLGCVRRHDLRPDGLSLRPSQLQQAIREAFGEAGAPFVPEVAVADENRREWQAWLRSNRKRLEVIAAQHRDGEAPDLVVRARLDRVARTAFDQMHFDPLGVVVRWLAECGVSISREEVEAQLATLAVTFQPVREPPVRATALRWRGVDGRIDGITGGPERKITAADIADADAARSAYGESAEQALLDWVSESTAPLLANDKAREVLIDAAGGPSTQARVREALARDDLRGALYIAELWSGAGFDILGLETLADGTVSPVRYECKGLPAGAGRVRVRLSRRELSVARSFAAGGVGRWCLVGVEPSGRCIDLTELLDVVLDATGGPLSDLAAHAIEADGLRLVIDRETPTL